MCSSVLLCKSIFQVFSVAAMGRRLDHSSTVVMWQATACFALSDELTGFLRMLRTRTRSRRSSPWTAVKLHCLYSLCREIGEGALEYTYDEREGKVAL